MGFSPKWEEFWDYYNQLKGPEQLGMKAEIKEIIRDASDDMKAEILKDAPKEFQAKEPRKRTKKIVWVRTPEELHAEQQRILSQFYSKTNPVIRSAKHLRHGNMHMESRYILRHMMFSIGGLFGVIFGSQGHRAGGRGR